MSASLFELEVLIRRSALLCPPRILIPPHLSCLDKRVFSVCRKCLLYCRI